MLRKMKNKGEESGGKIQKKVKSIGRKIRNFFARQYDALLHLDFQDKTNRTILRVVLINFAILFVVCLFLVVRYGRVDRLFGDAVYVF
mgnify:FL=1